MVRITVESIPTFSCERQIPAAALIPASQTFFSLRDIQSLGQPANERITATASLAGPDERPIGWYLSQETVCKRYGWTGPEYKEYRVRRRVFHVPKLRLAFTRGRSDVFAIPC